MLRLGRLQETRATWSTPLALTLAFALTPALVLVFSLSKEIGLICLSKCSSANSFGHKVEICGGGRRRGSCRVFALGVVRLEALPEADGLIGGGGGDGLTVGRGGELEDARRMALKLGQPRHRRIFPQDQLVVGEPVA